MSQNRRSFLFGAQYYRAPTPARECWDGDLRAMRDLGFTDVKFWVQWRWSHRAPDRFVFDDIDDLMDLAQHYGLSVTLNVIFDVAPLWLFETYPEAKQITSSGQVIEPYTAAHRQIGGMPGPCYNHPGALAERVKFLETVVGRYGNHPAMSMWDIWNEPEQSFSCRTPRQDNLTCYCDRCRKGFRDWLQRKYGNVERLNQVWGRCYEDWSQVEVPVNVETINDFIDWREFHLDTMSDEADWRIEVTRRLDPEHPAYLHVVPNTMAPFNSVSCVDDFAMARSCDVFAATMNADPATFSQVVSAADGRPCYNVESHINFGSTNMHQRILKLDAVLSDLLPQIGWGIKGFLFWQYRAETLGWEAPAWGLVRPDGTPRPATEAVCAFKKVLDPFLPELLTALPKPPAIGIWKSRRNEIFHFCIYRSLDGLEQSVNAYINTLYWNNLDFRMVSETMLEKGRLDGLKLLIMPSPYCLTTAETKALNAWVEQGGVLLTEAHLCGYNITDGRHSPVIPGGGLAESWDIREVESTSPRHLPYSMAAADNENMPADTLKALKQNGETGGRFYPIRLENDDCLLASDRFTQLVGGEVKGQTPDGSPCLVHQRVGEGQVWYCGANLFDSDRGGHPPLGRFVEKIAASANITPKADGGQSVHLDILKGHTHKFAVIVNREDAERNFCTETLQGIYRGGFSETCFEFGQGKSVAIPPHFTDILIPAGEEGQRY